MIKKSKRLTRCILIYPKILRMLSAKIFLVALRSFNYSLPKSWHCLGTSHYSFLSPKKTTRSHPTIIKWLQACVTTANYSLCINGEVTGYIKGRKGLRQGDPLSPYLFVIVMEVFTNLINKKSQLPNFHFHWRCKTNQLINLCFADDLMIFCKEELSSIKLIKEALINLCFADDLMIFCKGEFSSIKLIKEALTEFEALSGLSHSTGKSSIFFSRVSVGVKETILQELGFQEGSLPVRYLGVPLLSTKLKAIDCQRLVDSITAKTRS
ncbi:uncharacterized protein LOC131332819 [Rhododendron vialii]|uniref:uncharacterized protein LOC131332819 n=1 Tax=Rhododendron vialii TaxID=182163 RepID=UPI00265DAD7D|nr:uncharacterized protein LOC131332819 [Rhododendron vialii]